MPSSEATEEKWAVGVEKKTGEKLSWDGGAGVAFGKPTASPQKKKKKILPARKQTSKPGVIILFEKKRDKGKAGGRGRLEAALTPDCRRGTVWVLLETGVEGLKLGFFLPRNLIVLLRTAGAAGG